MKMTTKLILGTLVWFALVAGVAYSAATADAAVRDGQKCSIDRPDNARWRMAPDGCVYVTPYGGQTALPKAATEVSLVVDGRELTQRFWDGGLVWGPNIGDLTGTKRQYAFGQVKQGGVRYIWNGYFRVARAYWWAS